MNVFVLTLMCLSMITGPESPPMEQERLHQIAGAVSAQRIEADIRKLVGFGTRHTLSDTKSPSRGIGAARRWIKQEFEKISADCNNCLEVVYQAETIQGQRRIPNPVEVVNVLAIQRGRTDPNRYVVMSGDIDSRVSNVMDAQSESPGANDNASGVAGTLEAARLLSKYKFNASIIYAALSGEEQGLFGGTIMAKDARSKGYRVQAVLNNDMIGNIEGINGVINNSSCRVFSEGTRPNETAKEARERRFRGGELDSPSRNLARYIHRMGQKYIPNLEVMMINRLDRFGRGGHHRPFNDAGFPAVRIMETNENYNRQHQDLRIDAGIIYGDTIEGVNFAYAAKLTALNAVSLAAMATAPPPVAQLSISGAVQPSTTLSWRVADTKLAPNLAGYRVFWRLTTSPVWTHSTWVGLSAKHTLENLVIDNYFFGVASVSKQGYQSPVVFPGVIGAFFHPQDIKQ